MYAIAHSYILHAAGVLAATYPEWIAHWMLDSTLYPLPLSLGNALSLLFPLKTQGYYDDALEPLMAVCARHGMPWHIISDLCAWHAIASHRI